MAACIVVSKVQALGYIGKVPRSNVTKEEITRALNYAFELGKTCWQQASSKDWEQNKRVKHTHAAFAQLVVDIGDGFTQLAPSSCEITVAQPMAEPLGRLAYYHNGKTEFYPWPQIPYLDNAIGCKIVYDTPQPVFKDIE